MLGCSTVPLCCSSAVQGEEPEERQEEAELKLRIKSECSQGQGSFGHPWLCPEPCPPSLGGSDCPSSPDSTRCCCCRRWRALAMLLEGQELLHPGVTQAQIGPNRTGTPWITTTLGPSSSVATWSPSDGRPQAAPQVLTKTCSCHWAFCVGHFILSNKDGANSPASSTKVHSPSRHLAHAITHPLLLGFRRAQEVQGLSASQVRAAEPEQPVHALQGTTWAAEASPILPICPCGLNVSCPLPATPGLWLLQEGWAGRAGLSQQRSQALLPPPTTLSSITASAHTSGHSLHSSWAWEDIPGLPSHLQTAHSSCRRALGALVTHLQRCRTRWRPPRRQGTRAGPRWFSWIGCSSAASAPPSLTPAGRYLPEEHPWSPQTPCEDHRVMGRAMAAPPNGKGKQSRTQGFVMDPAAGLQAATC